MIRLDMNSHFQLRGLAYLLLSQVCRFGFLHGSRWSLRKVKRWLRDVLTAEPAPKPTLNLHLQLRRTQMFASIPYPTCFDEDLAKT